ncbi:hypothetical protein B0H16DRAFT_1731332 [Mycena metata]|uniref:Uncharacterized protein n=1 Tax=Mycena metata TaxID=1033252 RepID=A0AAD7MVV4_9AGAR|nr:hypothetical protein B0H16DRAFT_1731332 [Mycena metata]
MSDPLFPPFSQPSQHKPELHYDEAQKPQPLQAPFQYNPPVQPAQQAYNFVPAPQPLSSARVAPNYTAELRLPPLREPDIDPDLSDGPTIAKFRGIKPALKVGGVHQKGKHKRCNDSDSDSDTEERPTKCGPERPTGRMLLFTGPAN